MVMDCLESKDKYLPVVRNVTMKLLLKSILRYRPSRLMDWWTLFITLSITRTWRAIRLCFRQKILVCSCVSLPKVSENLFFWNIPIKRTRKPKYRAFGLAGNVAIIVVVFGKACKGYVRWTADLTAMFLLNDISSWTYGELIFHVFSELPEFYVNQHDEITLPNYVEESVPQA
jgi:hypothetical protein